ncbi:MAG: DUF1549 domain-containing protein [Pirellulales bacterium]
MSEGAFDPRESPAEVTDAGGIDLEAGRRHWAFQPLNRGDLPDVESVNWPRTPIDRYIVAKLEANGLRPVADADRHTWLRRVSFDLTGLPPTVDEVRDFVTDDSPAAREKVVDRLLASRAFGERWARHWLDLVGYADQVGTSNNVFAQHAWRYRDYVIDAFNSDKPFDRFIREQVSGDLLPAENAEQRAANLIATGFLVLGDVEIVEADKEKLRVDVVDQQVTKVGRAFLGMTLECARCHDHKFDPIGQRDYYAMAGIFHGTSSTFKTDRGVWSDVNVLELPETDEQRAERAVRERQHAEELASAESEREQAQAELDELNKRLDEADVSDAERDDLTKRRDDAAGHVSELDKVIQHAKFFAPTTPKAHGVSDVDAPADMRVTIRGNPRALGDTVPRGVLRVCSTTQPVIPAGESGRRELADWLAQHPLTARVTVNRIWQKLFGEGLVRSVDYFGLPGEHPTHPQLLDHLAAEFMRTGWSQKRLIRTLVLSRTYGLGSEFDERAGAIDPDNRLLWRMNRVRLDAEALRDAMLAVSGQLRASSGGPAIPLEYPENVGGLDPKDVNPPSFGLRKWRPGQELERTIYLPVIRHAAQPEPAAVRNVFDFSQPSQIVGKRDVTAVPTQALFLMNSPVIKRYAQALAERLSEEDDPTQRLELLWLALLNRPISETERFEASEFLQSCGEGGWTELCHALLASNEFLMRI